MLHYFPKVCQEIIFIIDGQCCVLLEIISSLEKWFDTITPFSKRDTVFGAKADFLEGRYTTLSVKFLDGTNNHIDQEPRIFKTPLVVGIHEIRKYVSYPNLALS